MLAFVGGYVNVGGFLCVHRFVSHVTGFAGFFALELIQANWTNAALALAVPIFFLLGSFLTGITTEVRRSREQIPIYVGVMSVIGFVYFLLGTLGANDWIGKFGEPTESLRDYIILASLCFAMGAQNALFTSYSGAVVRTTHLTGLTTDLGIGMARQLLNRDQSETAKNGIRLGLILSFLLGSVVAAFYFTSYGFEAFFTAGILEVGVGIDLYISRSKLS
ncbi:MAG: DUF1275 domain-containing protein [Bdellovibrionales bacterium]|nr:DUF1275 domain-containing protein [Bdellovibrionales bacterium]